MENVSCLRQPCCKLKQIPTFHLIYSCTTIFLGGRLGLRYTTDGSIREFDRPRPKR
jgi:hypothetical protein